MRFSEIKGTEVAEEGREVAVQLAIEVEGVRGLVGQGTREGLVGSSLVAARWDVRSMRSDGFSFPATISRVMAY
jgi:hypothetical protein